MVSASHLKASHAEIIPNRKLKHRLRFWGHKGVEEEQEDQLVIVFASDRHREKIFLWFLIWNMCTQVKQPGSCKIHQRLGLVIIYRDNSLPIKKKVHFNKFS